MHRAQKQKKQRKSDKKTTSDQTDESSQDASLPTTASTTTTTTPSTPSSMPPPSPSYSMQQPNPPKVAIPKLRRESDSHSGAASATSEQNRIAHACESCRQRKTKCSGERPRCKHCENFKLQCVYVDGKRDRVKKEFDSMAERLDEHEKLLKDISLHTDEITKQRITRALYREPSASEEPPETSFGAEGGEKVPRRKDKAIDQSSGSLGEHRYNARAGSLESVDRIDEDLNRDAKIRATGYYGKNSDISWMHGLRRRTEQDQDGQNEGKVQDRESTSSTAIPGSKRPIVRRPSAGLSSMSSSTYHCDDLSLSITNLAVNRYDVPSREVSDLLLQCYFDTVQPSFPIICSVHFVAEYKDFYADPTAVTDSWLAILNLMFAIGAKYAHLTRAQWAGREGDHLVYFTRARLLGFTGDTILGHASMQQVQISGLIAFFLMCIHQINRSWALSGIAIRHAATLGLNFRNNSDEVADFDKEMRCRTWWALCFLERQLAVMTGRTPSFSETDCSCPYPFPADEGSLLSDQSFKLSLEDRFGRDQVITASPPSGRSYSALPPVVDGDLHASPQVDGEKNISTNIGLYFLYLTKLSNFTNEVLSRLYRVSSLNKSWADTQSTVADLTERLEDWRQELPLAFDFTKRMRNQQWLHQRKALGFLYHSTMLIINRPCLCRIDRRIPHESGRAKQFNQATAAKCVHAAIDLLNLLPDEPDPVGMYTQSPWWSLVHHLVEAAVVCMLELSFRADHMPHEVDEVFESADKAVQWLWSMSSNDLAASRAWKMCDEMLRKVAPKVGKSVSDMLSQQQPLPDSMQGLQRSSHTQSPAFRPGGGRGPQDAAPFQPPVFTTYDQMMAQDPFLQNLLQTSTAGTYPNLYPLVEDIGAPTDYSNQQPDGYYIDPNLEQQQPRWYQDQAGRGNS